MRRFGDLDVAEDAVGEALVAAVENWRATGVPPNPGGWLTTTATRRAIDRLRRESSRPAREAHSAMLIESGPPEPTGVLSDDRLRLVFTCCHPALAPEVRVTLTLRLLGGLTVAEIARAFLVPEPTMAQRLTRAKRKIAAARIPYRVPGPSDLPARLGGVLATLYLVFNEGYLTGSGAEPTRTDLCSEAIRLARVLSEVLPEEPEATGLLALMLLTEARRAARFADGVLVPLREQDRTTWNHELIAEGHALVRRCLAIGRPGQYQILAAINAVHTDAAAFAQTDWSSIVRLYDHLAALAPTPVDALNRAVAVARARRPRRGAAPGRAARPDRLPRVARDPRRPAASAAPARRGGHGIRRRDRRNAERGGARLPAPAAGRGRPTRRRRVTVRQ